jgi:hypothetical protein
LAASSSPTPTTTPKASAQATPKPSATATKKVVPTKKPAAKTPAKKKAVKKKPTKVRVAPSPSAAWPPKGFKVSGDENNTVYAKIPSTKELVGILSAKSNLASQIRECSEVTCGAVLVASELGCRWWEISSVVIGATSDQDRTIKKFGSVRTTSWKTAGREIRTVLIITTEPIGNRHIIDQISVVCHQDPPTEAIPTSIFTPEIVDQ